MIEPLTPEMLILETPRLRLTPYDAGDEDIARAVLSDPAVMRYVAPAMTPEAVSAHMADAVKRGAGGRIGIWCIRRKDTGQKIGDALLMPIPIDGDDVDWSQVVPDAWPSDRIEVGYLLIPDAWGQGFATEVCARLVDFHFSQSDREELVAVTDPENGPSQAVLAKCGLIPIGTARAYGADDTPWFRITRQAWQRMARG